MTDVASTEGDDGAAPPHRAPDSEDLRVLIARLARPHRSGGRVVERASLLASGADFGAALAWIEAHGGKPEPLAPPKVARGVHGGRPSSMAPGEPAPLRFILPSAALR